MTAVKTTVGARGRVTIPAAVQRDSGVLEGDEVVVRSAGPGVVIVESVKAIKERIRAGVPASDAKLDAVAEIRAARHRDSGDSGDSGDSEISDKQYRENRENRENRDNNDDGNDPGLPQRGPGDQDPGAEMLRSLGL